MLASSEWEAGVSIGGINSAISAGNLPERRLERLREFWQMIISRHVWRFTPESGHRDTLRTLHHKDWLWTPVTAGGIIVHDVHRTDQEDM